MTAPQLAFLYNTFLTHRSVTTDTRNIQPGNIFFALKGPNFDGNTFASKALEQGAVLAVVDDPAFYKPDNMLLVPNVLEALQALALEHRMHLNIPIIAITGSNGKTTTKELVHQVLSTNFITSTTVGNLNNHIGIPLTLLRIPAHAEMAVIEMGANHQKEIEGYCRYTRPTMGMITNCGKAHLEGFGGVEGVKKGKGELFDYLRANNGQAFICSDFEYFKPMAEGLENISWYGAETGDVVGEVLESDPLLRLKITAGFSKEIDADATAGTEIHTQLVGGYNLYNVLAALAIGKHFKIDFEKMKGAIESYTPTNSRSQLVEKHGNFIILDAYNANPSSMAAAIDNFAKTHYANKMVFIGGMMELGAESINEHAAIINQLKKYDWKAVVLVGGDFGKTSHPYLYFNTSAEAAAWWQSQQSQNNTLLVKGSRSMKMELVVA